MNAIVNGLGECVNSVSAVSDDDLQTDINPGWCQQFKYEAIDIDLRKRIMRINVLRHKARMRDFRVQYNNACNRTELMRTFKSTQEKWQATLLNSALLQNPMLQSSDVIKWVGQSATLFSSTTTSVKACFDMWWSKMLTVFWAFKNGDWNIFHQSLQKVKLTCIWIQCEWFLYGEKRLKVAWASCKNLWQLQQTFYFTHTYEHKLFMCINVYS